MAAEASMGTRVLAAASQGAVGACVGAALSATAEPVVNKILVKRMTLAEALEDHGLDKILKFFKVC